MPWENSGRRERLPADWEKIRKRILRRDSYRCTHTSNGIRCNTRATDVDHVRRGDDHSEDNLTSLCKDHHAIKSSREGNAAKDERRRQIRQRFRRVEVHPGKI